MFGVTGILLTIHPPGIISLSFVVPSTTLGVVCLSLIIPSTRNLLFLLHDVFNRVRMILGNAGFLLRFPSPQESPLYFTWTLLFPPSSPFLPYCLLSMVLELETNILSLSLALGQKP